MERLEEQGIQLAHTQVAPTLPQGPPSQEPLSQGRLVTPEAIPQEQTVARAHSLVYTLQGLSNPTHRSLAHLPMGSTSPEEHTQALHSQETTSRGRQVERDQGQLRE